MEKSEQEEAMVREGNRIREEGFEEGGELREGIAGVREGIAGVEGGNSRS